MKIFFSVGEPSGDLHGANLIRELRRSCPDVEAVGYGGPRMAAAGCQLHEDLTRLAVMWFLQVFTNLHKFLVLLSRADRYFRHARPDAVVLIDYPGFNWWIARRAKAHGIPVFYYGTPQMWAWAGWRVKKMRRLVDHVLCKLPFEQEWYRQRGCHATFVGHPYFDEVQQRELDEEFVKAIASQAGPLVTILPGSRTQEVRNNLHWFLKAAGIVRSSVPTAQFAIASFNEKQAALAREQVERSGVAAEVFVGRTPELIHAAVCTMACSGSVSLELLYHRKPTVILYWVTRRFYLFVKCFARIFQVKVKYITLVNMLADEPFAKRPRPFDPEAPGSEKVPFPEFPTCGDKSDWLASYVVRWLTDDAERQRRIAQLDRLRGQVAHGGASRAAAAYIVQHVGGRRTAPVPRPHFIPSRGQVSAETTGLARRIDQR